MPTRTTLLSAIALCAMLLFASVGVAHADGFIDNTRLTLDVEPGKFVPAGTVVTLSGTLVADEQFCRAGSEVTLRAHAEEHGEPFPGGILGTTVTDADGNYSFDLEVTEQIRVRVWFSGKVGGVHPDINTCRKSRSRVLTLHIR